MKRRNSPFEIMLDIITEELKDENVFDANFDDWCFEEQIIADMLGWGINEL